MPYRMAVNEGLYISLYVVLGRHVYYVTGNVDFAEDTPDDKHILNATAMARYQRCQPGGEVPVQELPEKKTSVVKDVLKKGTKLLECPKPDDKPTNGVFAFLTLSKDSQLLDASLPDVIWLMGRTLAKF